METKGLMAETYFPADMEAVAGLSRGVQLIRTNREQWLVPPPAPAPGKPREYTLGHVYEAAIGGALARHRFTLDEAAKIVRARLRLKGAAGAGYVKDLYSKFALLPEFQAGGDSRRWAIWEQGNAVFVKPVGESETVGDLGTDSDGDRVSVFVFDVGSVIDRVNRDLAQRLKDRQ